MSRSLAAAIAIAVACGSPRPRQSDRQLAQPPPIAAIPQPGLRLPATAIPRAYDLRLELDPARESFGGRVEIRVTLTRPTDRVWLHAVDLEIASATFRAGDRSEPLVAGAPRDELRSFLFGRTLPAGEIVLAFEYTGLVGREVEGVFRQRKQGAWFLFTQAQATFARKIVPCFDEPALRAPWRATVVVPSHLVALGNAPVASETGLPRGRKEVRFAETSAISSYLLAFAVGPFRLVDGGVVGRARVPVRVAVAAGHERATAAVVAWTPKLVDALEQYLDQPLPLAKLDFVAVPSFFGAMENPGLVLFEDNILLGDARDAAFVRKLVRFVGHELAHQWFGNSVTPAWWSDLWISEAFATFFDDKLSSVLGALDDAPLRTQLSRAQALRADREIDAHPLRRPIASTEDIEDAFDAISYEKGAAVLAMLEDSAGEAAFRDLLRVHVRKHAGRAITAAEVQASFAPVAPVLADVLDRRGAPVVDLATRCQADRAALTIVPRDGAVVPLCIRHPAGRACTLARGKAELALPRCDGWIVTNANGRGYYHAHGLPLGDLAPLTVTERIALGHDRAAAVARGELSAKAALDDIAAFVATKDPYARLAALAIARELVLVSDARTQAALGAWLAPRFVDRATRTTLFAPRTPLDRALREALMETVPADHLPAALHAHARELVDRALASPGAAHERVAFVIAGARGGKPLFERVLAAARRSEPWRAAFLVESLGAFDASLAPRVADLILDRTFDAETTWSALATMFDRAATRSAAWTALRDRLPRVLGELAPVEAKAVVEAVRSLCTAAERAEVHAAFTTHVATIPDGPALLARSLAAIDRCAARAAKVDLAAALAP